jgi:hypothetical protein
VKRFFFILASGIWILASGISHAVLDTNDFIMAFQENLGRLKDGIAVINKHDDWM